MGNGQGKQSFSSGHGKAYILDHQHAHSHPLRRPISVLGLSDSNLNQNLDYSHHHANHHGAHLLTTGLINPNVSDYQQQMLSANQSICANSDCSGNCGNSHHQRLHHQNHRNFDSSNGREFVAHHNQRNALQHHPQHALQKNKLMYASHETILNPSYHGGRKRFTPSPSHFQSTPSPNQFKTPSSNQQHQQRHLQQRQQSFLSDREKKISSPVYPQHHQPERSPYQIENISDKNHLYQSKSHANIQYHHHQGMNNHHVKGKYSHNHQNSSHPNHNQSNASPTRKTLMNQSASFSHDQKYYQHHKNGGNNQYNDQKLKVGESSNRRGGVSNAGSYDNARGGVKRAIVQKKVQNKGAKILPPLPRSHSFHQILKPTENGQILAKKGTIRGFNCEISAISASTSDLRIRDEETHPIGDAETSVDQNVESPNLVENPELMAILKYRRCKSETDLLTDHEDNNDTSVQSSNHQVAQNDNYISNDVMVSGHRPSSKVTSGNSANNGVAGKIFKSKYRAPPPPNSASVSVSKVSTSGTDLSLAKIAPSQLMSSGHHQQVSKASGQKMNIIKSTDNNQTPGRDNNLLPVQKTGTKGGLASDKVKTSTSYQAGAVKSSYQGLRDTKTVISSNQNSNGHQDTNYGHHLNERKERNFLDQKTCNFKTPIHHASSSRLELAQVGASKIPISSRTKGSNSNLHQSNFPVNDRNLVFDSNQITSADNSKRQIIKVNSRFNHAKQFVNKSSVSNLDKKHAMTRSSSNLLSESNQMKTPVPIGYNNLSSSIEINLDQNDDDEAIKILNEFEASIICQRDNDALREDPSYQIRREKSLNNLDDVNQLNSCNRDYANDGTHYHDIDAINYRKLHPAFDDNFILKRATPSAGLDLLTPINPLSKRHQVASHANGASDNHYYFAQLILPSPPASPPPMETSDSFQEIHETQFPDNSSSSAKHNLMTMSGGGTYSKRKRNILLPSSSNASSYAQKKNPPKTSARPDEKLKYSPAIIRWLSERDAVTAQVNNSDPGNLSTQNSTRLPDSDMTDAFRIENGKRKGEYNGNQRRRATIENGIQIDVPVVDTMTNTTGFQQEHKANVSKPSKPDFSYNDQNKVVKRAVSTEHLTSVGHSGIKPVSSPGKGHQELSQLIQVKNESRNDLNCGQTRFKVASKPEGLKRTNTTLGIESNTCVPEPGTGPWAKAKQSNSPKSQVVDNFLLQRVTPNAGLLFKNGAQTAQSALPVPSVIVNGVRSGRIEGRVPPGSKVATSINHNQSRQPVDRQIMNGNSRRGSPNGTTPRPNGQIQEQVCITAHLTL